jgi:hypothetical protein
MEHPTLVSLKRTDSELKLYNHSSRLKTPLEMFFPTTAFCSLASALGFGATPVVGSATHFLLDSSTVASWQALKLFGSNKKT